MSEATKTWIGEMSGIATHTGPGDQTINVQLMNERYQVPGSLARDSRGRTPRTVATQDLLWLYERFEPPVGFEDAVEKLKMRGTVLLEGKKGDGRNAAARMLLRRLPHEQGPVQELLLGEEERNSSLLLDHGLVGDEDRLLLDLSEKDEECWRRVREELSSFRASVQQRQAGMVLILPPGMGHLLTSELADLRYVISRPPGMELDIIKRHMRSGGIDPTLADPPRGALKDFLDPSPSLSDVATFAQYLCRAAADGGSFDVWCHLALDAFRGQPVHAARLLRVVRKGAPRALLVATAMLHEARGDAVHRSASLLLAAVDPTAQTRPALQHRPLSERLTDIEARTDDNGRVTFTGLEIDAALRTRVWHDLPDLRGPLRDWVGEVVSLPELDEPDRDALVGRFAEQSFASRRPDDLIILSQRWSRTPGNLPQLRAAACALSHGLHNREYGAKFRKRILHWSTSQHLSMAQRRVLVEVCHEDMAVRHPHAALVRLHHLARREKPSGLAVDALVQLVDDDHRLRRRILARLARALASAAGPNTKEFLTEDTDLFLRFGVPEQLSDYGARSRPLIAESAVRNDLVAGWSTVFGTLLAERWTGLAHRWLNAACTPSPFAEHFLDVLVSACRQRGDQLGMLYRVGRRWAAAQPIQDARTQALPGRLFLKISDALRAQTPFARETTTT
ncbi:hypothetical protein [Streptomyces sp. NPDC056641]|uniref:hypothetical protein n=1 Tax=unclassified Streptomyces TaxID=2593676 RepID=UPI00365E28E8